jgi:hypothetical protein
VRHALLSGDFTVRVDSMPLKAALSHIDPHGCAFHANPSLSFSDAAMLTHSAVIL